MSKSLSQALEAVSAGIKSGKYDAMFKKMADEQIEKNEKLKAFYQSSEFEALLAKFDQSDLDVIFDDGMMYFPEKYPFSADEFTLLWESIWRANKDLVTEDEGAMFETYNLEWRGYVLSIMHGQGSVASMAKIK